MQTLVDRFESALSIELELDQALVQGERAESELIPERVRLSAYRIAEEALTNALKHAEAGKVSLALGAPSDGSLLVRVRDDGRGVEPDADGRGMGIGTMRDYAEVVRGECAIRSVPGQGTEVTATLPFTDSDVKATQLSVQTDNQNRV